MSDFPVIESYLGFLLDGTGEVKDRVQCADGESLSVQASRNHYCTPRNNEGPYTHVEVGFPSVDPGEDWREYQEDMDDPTGTVYGYVPIELVEKFIAAHGGRAEGGK